MRQFFLFFIYLFVFSLFLNLFISAYDIKKNTLNAAFAQECEGEDCPQEEPPPEEPTVPPEEPISCPLGNVGDVCDTTPYGAPNRCCGDGVCNDIENMKIAPDCSCTDRFVAEADVPHPEYTLPGCGAPTATPTPVEPTETPLPTPRQCDILDAEYNECCAPGKSKYVKKFTSVPSGGACGWEIGECDQADLTCAAAATVTPTPIPEPTETTVPGSSPTPTSRPGSTATPTPTPRKTATPTPVQSSQILSSLPTPTKASSNTGGLNTSLSQRWVCLQAAPCSKAESGCSGQFVKDIGHRVKLSSKTDVKPLQGATYIAECLITSQGQKCTTGNSNLDRQVLGTDNFSLNKAAFGYDFFGFFQQNGLSQAANPIQTPANGNIGSYEWESTTKDTLGRVFLALNFHQGSAPSGNQNTQQQGTLSFEPANKNCIMIRWDPEGKVFDSYTLEPLQNVQLALFKKNENNLFGIVNGNDLLGGIVNPVKTSKEGSFSFSVPDGTYKIKAQISGYKPYESREFVQKGETVRHDIWLDPLSKTDLQLLLKKVQNFFNNILDKDQ